MLSLALLPECCTSGVCTGPPLPGNSQNTFLAHFPLPPSVRWPLTLCLLVSATSFQFLLQHLLFLQGPGPVYSSSKAHTHGPSTTNQPTSGLPEACLHILHPRDLSTAPVAHARDHCLPSSSTSASIPIPLTLFRTPAASGPCHLSGTPRLLFEVGCGSDISLGQSEGSEARGGTAPGGRGPVGSAQRAGTSFRILNPSVAAGDP